MKIQFQYKYLQLSLIVLVGTIFLSTSCSTQKRKYVKGFYIEHISKKQENKTLLSQANVDIKTNSLNQYHASSI
jgi:hypothetical protein